MAAGRLFHEAAIADGLAAVAEFEAEFGTIPAEVSEWARRELNRAGVGSPLVAEPVDRRDG